MSTTDHRRHGFLYTGGTYLDSKPTVMPQAEHNVANGEFGINLGTHGTLSLPYAVMNDLIVDMARALFDSGKMTMEAAEHLSYLSNIVLRDPDEAMQAAAADYGYDDIHDGWVTDEV